MNDKPLGITELITRVGDQHVQLQNLVENMTGCRSKKCGRETEVTFVTSQNFIDPNRVAANSLEYIGLVLWLPKAEVERARREFNADVPA